MQNMQDLINDMQSYGLLINKHKIVHNKIGRCATRNKPKSKNGWYIIHINGDLITALYGDYQQGKNPIKWNNKTKLTSQERKQQQTDYIKYQQQLDQEKQSRLQYIRKMYNQLPIINKNKQYSYFTNKSINHWLRCSSADPLKTDKVGNIIVPLRNLDNELMGYQIITPQGNKRFIKGSAKKGNFYLMIADGLGIEHCHYLFVGEGLSTMISWYLAMNEYLENHNYACVVAFDVSNIESVVVNICNKHNNIPVTLIADNDCESDHNIGVETCNAIKDKLCNQFKIDVFIPELTNRSIA